MIDLLAEWKVGEGPPEGSRSRAPEEARMAPREAGSECGKMGRFLNKKFE